MILSDYHMHTTYCDGKNTPEEMVLAAIKKGMTDIGFSVHSYTFFDESYCIKEEKIEEYINEISRLKEQYQDKIRILCGVVQDYYATAPTDKFDYVIGSVHYLKCGEKFQPLDLSAEALLKMTNEIFGGDFYLMAEQYFATLSDVVNKTGADIIGHFDLITKFCEQENFFDMRNERYLSAAKKCVDKLISYGKPFEINTGAISRGYRSAPYPALEIIEYIKEKGGRFILSSDAHSTDGLMYQFDKWENLI